MSTPITSAAHGIVAVSFIEPGLGGMIKAAPATLINYRMTDRTLTDREVTGTLTAAELLDGGVTNFGASGSITLTLPTVAAFQAEFAARGMTMALGESFVFGVYNDTAQNIVLAPSASVTFANGASTITAASGAVGKSTLVRVVIASATAYSAYVIVSA